MKKIKFAEAQRSGRAIVFALRQADTGTVVSDVYRQCLAIHGVQSLQGEDVMGGDESVKNRTFGCT